MHPSLTSRSSGARGAAALLVAATAFAAAGCIVKKPAEEHYYDEHIQPIFNSFCINNTSPCHRVDPTTQVALGNLDLTSFENVQKRRDVLRTYGSYPTALLLMKALPDGSRETTIQFRGKNYQSEILHSGGKPISPGSDAFEELTNWLKNGANRDGILPVGGPNQGLGGCAMGDGAIPAGWVPPTIDTTSSAYTTFQSTIFPMIVQSCAYATCHSATQADFYMTCGDTPMNQLFNYTRAASFVTPAPTLPTDPATVDGSEILVRPLSVLGGGINHTGGEFFQNRNDATWKQWESWALDVQAHPLATPAKSPGRMFFEANVLPKLVQRGCAFEGCHSPDGFNDFRLRPGAKGFLSDGAVTRDYDTLANEFMAFDSVDVRQSRAVKKTTTGGITHRGGSLLEDLGVTSDVPCPTPFPATYDPTLTYDATNPATARAFCVVQEWHRLERQDRAAAVSPMATGDVLPLVFVSRPPNPDSLVQFDTYEGGADLELADATLGADGLVMGVANVRSALTPCAALAGQDVDVRGPEWSYDGTKVVFAARPGAASGLDLWLLDVAGGTCKQLTTDAGRAVNGVRVHNFDPVFAPDGSVVFASTRAGTVTLKNFLPNSDLFRVGPSLDFTNPQQMTFLLNSELSPAFMQDGRVSFTAEKATPDFYQLSGRRMNWDLTDYHPLLAQRAQSTDTFTTTEHPSVGYQQATEIREGLDRNFLIILSDTGSKGGGGALATFNRSIGPFEADRPDVTFVKSMVIVDPAAPAHVGMATQGVYRSPFSLPNGEILASYAANVTDPAMQTPKYDLVAVGPTGARRALVNDPTLSYVEGALGYKRSETQLFTNLPQLVFGGHDAGGGGTATMHFPDLPLLATLLGANLRRGRDVAAFDGATGLRAYVEQPPPVGSTPANPPAGLMGSQMVYSQRTALGTAPLQSDHSVKVSVPAAKPLILELVDDKGPLFTMSEEHQVTSGEYITPGAPRALFNNICAGCHGSISGQELDIAVTADTLTGASVSASRDLDPVSFQ